jgi:putative ABC transport system permease protein
LFTLQNQALGYNPQNALTFLMPLSEGHYTQWANRQALYQDIVNRLRRLPKVEVASISATGTPPYNGFGSKVVFDDRPASQASDIRVNLIQDGYFAAVGTRLLRGRDLTAADVLQGRPVAVIAQDMIQRDFPGQDPIGHHIQIDIFNQPIPRQILKAPNFTNSFEIVGVVATARNRGLNDPPVPAVFLPYSILIPPETFVIARTKGDPEVLIGPARSAVRAADASQPITLTRTLEGWLDTATAYPRFATFLFGVFGNIGLLLAAAGVFSVVSHAVAHRTREFGIGMALGAQRGDILGLVVLTTGRVLTVGLLVGLSLSIVTSRMLADKMQGMGTADPVLFVLVPVALVIATAAACFLPARAATLIQPMEALRHE